MDPFVYGRWQPSQGHLLVGISALGSGQLVLKTRAAMIFMNDSSAAIERSLNQVSQFGTDGLWINGSLRPKQMSSLILNTIEFFNLEYDRVLKSNESESFSKSSFEVSPKIIWQQTTSYPRTTIDTERRWFRNTIQ